MESNPFLVHHEMPPRRPRAQEKFVERDNWQLIMRSGTELPPYCVRTGEPVSEERMETRILHYWPFWVFLMMFPAPFIGFVLYAWLRQKCLVRYGLSAKAKRPYWIRVGIASAIMVAAVVCVLIGAKLKMGYLFLASVILVILGGIVMLVGNTTLSAARHENGRFWIKGFSPEFLTKIEG